MSDSGAERAERVPYGFAEFERRAAVRRRRARWRTGALRAAWAASLLTVVVLAWHGSRPAREQRPVAPSLARSVLADERWLAAVEPAASRVQVDTRLASVALEQQIALVDDLLSDARVSSDPLLTLRRLESERARLVDSLVRVRHAEALILAAR
jgi:hypothetical protein